MSCGHRNNQRVTQQHKESLQIGRAVVSTWEKMISGDVGQAEHVGDHGKCSLLFLLLW